VKKGFEEAVALLSKFSNEDLPEKPDIETYVFWQRNDRHGKRPKFEIPQMWPFVVDSSWDKFEPKVLPPPS
jgi:hypothetical protein